jgi:uncharacterized membrane protein
MYLQNVKYTLQFVLLILLIGGLLMTKERFKKILAVVVVFEGAIIGGATAQKMPALALITFMLALWLIYFLKTKVKDITEDEMILMYSGKAALKVYQVFGIVVTALGIIFISLGQGRAVTYAVGITLSFCSMFLLLLYMLFYAYYTRELRGIGNRKNEK